MIAKQVAGVISLQRKASVPPAILFLSVQEALPMYVVFQSHPGSPVGRLIELTDLEALALEQKCINSGYIVAKASDPVKAILAFGKQIEEIIDCQALFGGIQA